MGCEGKGALEQRAKPGRRVLGITGTLLLYGSNAPTAPHSPEPTKMGAQGPQGCPDAANGEGCRIPTEKPYQAGQEGPQCCPFPPHGAIPVSLCPERSGDPIPTGRSSGDQVGTWQPGSHLLGSRPAQARSRQESCCPSHRHKLPSEPPCYRHQSHTALQPHSLALPSLFSVPARTSRPTKPTRRQPGPPTSPRAHPGMATAPCSPHNCCPHFPVDPTMHSGDNGWEGEPQRVSPGQRQGGEGTESPSLAFCCGFPITDGPLSAKTKPARVSSAACPCYRGSPQAALQPCSGCWGEDILCQALLLRSRKAKNCCQGG